MKKGKFIVFEGLDGSGKTVQAEIFYGHLKKRGVRAVLTREPTDQGPIGILIRQVLQKKIKLNSPEAFQLLYCADRAEHLKKVVEPALEKGFWVISDRYYYSTIAYGYLASVMTRNWLVKINQRFLTPNKTLFFKVRPKICLERIDKGRDGKEFFEVENKLKKVWSGYQWCAKNFKEVKILNGEKSIKEIASQVQKTIRL